jgi:hypothetical protein
VFEYQLLVGFQPIVQPCRKGFVFYIAILFSLAIHRFLPKIIRLILKSMEAILPIFYFQPRIIIILSIKSIKKFKP